MSTWLYSPSGGTLLVDRSVASNASTLAPTAPFFTARSNLVGVGTSNPSSLLHVAGGNVTVERRILSPLLDMGGLDTSVVDLSPHNGKIGYCYRALDTLDICGFGTNGQGLRVKLWDDVFTSSNLTVGKDLVVTGGADVGTIRVGGSRVAGQSVDAGKIAYSGDNTALNIVGAGVAPTRRVAVYDNVTVAGGADVGTIRVGGSRVAGQFADAGLITYSGDNTALNIVGAGTTSTNRRVQIYDNLVVNRDATVANKLFLPNDCSLDSVTAVDTTNGSDYYLNIWGRQNPTMNNNRCVFARDRLITLYVHATWMYSASLNVTGTKNFNIRHPLDASKNLMHCCVEAPRADLIYRGTARLERGRAVVDIPRACNMSGGMQAGTFAALTRNHDVFLQNRTGFAAVTGRVDGEALHIECADGDAADDVSWMVVCERNDAEIRATSTTDDDGYFQCEWEGPPP